MLDPRLEDDVRRRRAASGRVRNAPRYSWIDVVIWIVALGALAPIVVEAARVLWKAITE